MLREILFAACALCVSNAFSQITVEKSCYSSSMLQKNGKHISLQSRIYYDSDMGREIGAMVKYRNGKVWIPLVVVEKIELDEDSPALGNNRTRRVELINGRVGGTYDYVQEGAGVKAGKYMEYKSEKNKTSILFQYSSNYENCE